MRRDTYIVEITDPQKSDSPCRWEVRRKESRKTSQPLLASGYADNYRNALAEADHALFTWCRPLFRPLVQVELPLQDGEVPF